MTPVQLAVHLYVARGWQTVPNHTATKGACSCGNPKCRSAGKHPSGDWPGWTSDPQRFQGRNVGVVVGPVSANLADTDCDCDEAIAAAPHVLPATHAKFGRGGKTTHWLNRVTAGTVGYMKLTDPVLSGSEATIVELRWSDTDPKTGELLPHQSVFPPSVHQSGETVEWIEEGEPGEVDGAELVAAVRRVGAATLIARYARPKERHQLVLLLGNLGVRAGMTAAAAEQFITAVFAARRDADMLERIDKGEASRAVADARKRVADKKHAAGLPSLRAMLDAGLPPKDGDSVVARVAEWLGVQPELKHPSTSPQQPLRRPARYIPIPDWKPFPVALLPEPWRGFVTAASEAVGADPAFFALPVLAVIGGAIGNTRRVTAASEAVGADPAFFALPVLAVIGGAIGNTRRVALKKNWTEPPVTWAVIVGESSTLKSPALATVTDPVREVQERHIAEFQQETEAFADTLQCWLDRKKEYVKWQKADEKARKGGKRSNPDDEGLPPEDPGPRPAPPTMKRVYVADTTIERLAEILDENPRGLLIVRDELSGWLGSFTKYKGKSGATDLPNWLEMHRAGPVIVDRKTGDKKFTYVPRAACSVVGGIQPGILTRQLTPEFMASGLTARLLMAMPPVRVKAWSEAEVGEDTVAAVRRNLESLYALDFVTPENDDRPRAYINKLSPEAKQLWVGFYDRWAKRQATAEGELAAAFGKIEAYAARFALLYHVVTTAEGSAGTGAVTAEAMRHGIALAMWFAHETERVYAMFGESEEETELRKLVETVRRLAARNGGRVTPKTLQRSNQKRYRTSDDAAAALDGLVTAGLGRWDETPGGPLGRPPAKAFVPTLPVGVTGDESDESPDDQPPDQPPESDPPAGGGCDESPPGGNGPPPGCPAGQPASGCPASGCDERPADGSGVSSLSSPVTPQDGPSETTPAGDGFAPDSSVTPSDPPPTFVTPGYTLVTTAEGVNLLAGGVGDWGGPVAVDCETTGLNPDADRVRLIQVAFGGTVAVVDVFASSYPKADLAPLFEALAGVEVVGHTLKFDLAFLARLGFVPGGVYCTMIASQVLHAGEWGEAAAADDAAADDAAADDAADDEESGDEEAGGAEPEGSGGGRLAHSLAAVAARELGVIIAKDEQRSDWSRPTLTPEQLRYAADDVRHLIPLAERLKVQLAAANLTTTAALEMRATRGIAWATPVAIDAAAWSGLATQAAAEQVTMAAEMDAIAPNKNCLPGAETRNWKSTPQVKEAFHALGIEVASTTDAVLAALDHPLAEMVRRFRTVAKRTGTYGLKWLTKHAPTGFVYPDWKQLGAESGRMSCSNPNLQAIPRDADYRKCFVARPGRLLVKADYSQIELRAAAAIAGEAKMLAAYLAGDDLHTLTAAAITGKPVADVQKPDRQLAKAVNFGLLYGMGYKSLGGYAKRKYFVTLTDEEAKKYHAAFFKSYPGLKSWHTGIENRLKAHIRKDPEAVVPTWTLGGRRRMIPAAKRSADGRPYPNKTEHANFPVQGTAADGMKAAVGLLWERRDQCPGAVPVLFVHDEIVVEVPEQDADAAKAWLIAAMRDGMQPLIPAVPVEVDATVGKTWGG